MRSCVYTVSKVNYFMNRIGGRWGGELVTFGPTGFMLVAIELLL